jgi:uncharacterized protein (TIGR03905 family)
MTYTYTPRGVCSRSITLDVEDGIIQSVSFLGGCNGNLKGISTLVAGLRVEDAIRKLEGIDCGGRGTSCPDQLAQALKQCI